MLKRAGKHYQGMVLAWPSASQTEAQDSSTKSSHENLAGEQNLILAMAYDGITRNCQNMFITTRCAAHSKLTSI